MAHSSTSLTAVFDFQMNPTVILVQSPGKVHLVFLQGNNYIFYVLWHALEKCQLQVYDPQNKTRSLNLKNGCSCRKHDPLRNLNVKKLLTKFTTSFFHTILTDLIEFQK